MYAYGATDALDWWTGSRRQATDAIGTLTTAERTTVTRNLRLRRRAAGALIGMAAWHLVRDIDAFSTGRPSAHPSSRVAPDRRSLHRARRAGRASASGDHALHSTVGNNLSRLGLPHRARYVTRRARRRQQLFVMDADPLDGTTSRQDETYFLAIQSRVDPHLLAMQASGVQSRADRRVIGRRSAHRQYWCRRRRGPTG
jgi:hypothetical protein